MVGADGLRHFVARGHAFVRLDLFLQPALGILGVRGGLPPLNVGGEQTEDDILVVSVPKSG